MNKIIITGGAGFIGSNAAFIKKNGKFLLLIIFQEKGAKINLVRIKKRYSLSLVILRIKTL